jgi:urate oxidase
VTLASNREYTHGDNSGIVESDSHANLMYILANQHGIKSPEDFGVKFAKTLLSRYAQITKVEVDVEEVAWKRIKYENDGNFGSENEHNHAFVNDKTCVRFTRVEMDEKGRFKTDFFS